MTFAVTLISLAGRLAERTCDKFKEVPADESRAPARLPTEVL